MNAVETGAESRENRGIWKVFKLLGSPPSIKEEGDLLAEDGGDSVQLSVLVFERRQEKFSKQQPKGDS